VDPVTLIVAALAAGASAGAIEALKDDAKEKAKALYEKLRGLARKRVSGRPDGEIALERYESAPQKWRAMLTDELTAAGAADDADLRAAATELMKLVDEAGTRAGKYNVTITNSQGVQIGDHGIQINQF